MTNTIGLFLIYFYFLVCVHMFHEDMAYHQQACWCSRPFCHYLWAWELSGQFFFRAVGVLLKEIKMYCNENVSLCALLRTWWAFQLLQLCVCLCAGVGGLSLPSVCHCVCLSVCVCVCVCAHACMCHTCVCVCVCAHACLSVSQCVCVNWTSYLEGKCVINLAQKKEGHIAYRLMAEDPLSL